MHNIYNALAAIAVTKHFGIDFRTIRGSLKDFRLPKMRLEYIRANGIELINDAYNSNPDSLKAAVDTLVNLPTNKRKVVVTADMLELGKESEHLHKDVGKYIGSRKEIDLLIGVGNFSGSVANGARERGMAEANVKSFLSLDSSLNDIISLIRPDDLLLVKGSRLMQMERLVEKIKADFK
jgi:UDP-N-acetylmuramoyl-tripeptide--D-alanyl-D-alanine ligase